MCMINNKQTLILLDFILNSFKKMLLRLRSPLLFLKELVKIKKKINFNLTNLEY